MDLLHKISKLSYMTRLLWIGGLFYIWIRLGDSQGFLIGNRGLFMSFLVLAFLACLFLLPQERKEN